jgi:uncharacterized protein (DUF1800 family)
MPVPAADVEHLLRRTEFVARPHRANALTAMATLEAAVDDILAVAANPGTCTFTATDNFERSVDLTYYWFDRMAHDSPRPIQEKIAFFWHGHFCSDLPKVGRTEPMRDQIDLFRGMGMTDLRTLAVTMSTQVAMLRYLDNNRNSLQSPNQNFARELMELFLLGVGNYTEADVESATAAWSGHGDDPQAHVYVWRPVFHDGAPRSFLGSTINVGPNAWAHGYETIDVILGNGVVPLGAAINRGRPTRQVVGEFLSRKLWRFFAGTEAPAAVVNALRDVAVQSGFSIRPWLRALLLRPEFYTPEVKHGLVRSPVDLMVAFLAATGLRARYNVPMWLLDGMGQRPFFPPNVAGWEHNGYFVNAGAMANRVDAARQFGWLTQKHYWDGDGLIHLAGGTISRDEVSGTYLNQPERLVDRILSLMNLKLGPGSLNALYQYARSSGWEYRGDVVTLALMTPEMNVA